MTATGHPAVTSGRPGAADGRRGRWLGAVVLLVSALILSTGVPGASGSDGAGAAGSDGAGVADSDRAGAAGTGVTGAEGGPTAPSGPRPSDTAVTSMPAVDDRVLIRWHAAVGDEQRAASVASVEHHLAAAAVSLAGRDGVALTATVDVLHTRPGHADAVVRILAGDPAVRDVERDRVIATTADQQPPNDVLFGFQWGLHNTGQVVGSGAATVEGEPGVDVRALAAWEVTRGSPDALVAVIDTVIDPAHRDLQGAVIGQFRAPSLANAPEPGQHGTGVASVIAARADDAFGIAGIAPEVSILDVAAFDERDDGGPGGATLAGILIAIEEAVTAGANVINASWVTNDGGRLLRDAVAESGAVVVAASGNEGRVLSPTRSVFPAGYDLPNVLAVTAVAPDGRVPSFANTGAEVVDVGAPGDLIPVALPGDAHGLAQGTSFAAPYVSGAVAMAFSVAPYADADEVADAVIWTSRVLPSLTGTTRSGGMLDAAALVQGIQRPVCRPDRLPPVDFSDVPPTNVHAAGISCLGVVEVALGREDGTYGPAAPVTRAQLSSLLARVLIDRGVPPTTVPPGFDDVDPASVHAPSIALLTSLGVILGDADGRFRPEDPVTRGQMASLLVRTYEVLVDTASEPSRSWFGDTGSSVHRPAIDVGRDLGILRGVGGGDYDPSTVTRRDQIASFLARTLDALGRAEARADDQTGEQSDGQAGEQAGDQADDPTDDPAGADGQTED